MKCQGFGAGALAWAWFGRPVTVHKGWFRVVSALTWGLTSGLAASSRHVAQRRPGCRWAAQPVLMCLRRPPRLRRCSHAPPRAPGPWVVAAEQAPGESGSSRWPAARGSPRWFWAPRPAAVRAAFHRQRSSRIHRKAPDQAAPDRPLLNTRLWPPRAGHRTVSNGGSAAHR